MPFNIADIADIERRIHTDQDEEWSAQEDVKCLFVTDIPKDEVLAPSRGDVVEQLLASGE